GRGPALVTAMVSAASLDFFLTRPYLSLRIEDPGDIIAFLGLGACALVAAAFGRRRHEFSEAARRSNRDVDALNGLVARMEAGVPLPEVLDGLRQSFDLERVALRDAQDRVLAVSPPGSAPSPRAELDPATLLERDSTRYTWGGHGFRLPEGG